FDHLGDRRARHQRARVRLEAQPGEPGLAGQVGGGNALLDAAQEQAQHIFLLGLGDAGVAVGRRQVVRQVQGVQGELGGLVQRVVVAVAEGQARRVEPAGAVADQVDDRLQFFGHGGRLRSAGTKYSGGGPLSWPLPPPFPIAQSMSKRALLLLAIVVLAAGLGLWASQRYFAPQPVQPVASSFTVLPTPRALPPFALQQSDGTPLTGEELRGHWTVVFLGFTHCPDICPTTLAQL